MIDELEMIKAIVGELTGAGLWVVFGVIAYKILTNLMMIGGAGWLVKKIFEYLKAGITRQEAEIIKSDYKKVEQERDLLKIKHRTELDEIKAMYKILKEAKHE